MSLTLTKKPDAASLPVYAIREDEIDTAGLDASVLKWAKSNGFTAAKGQFLPLPGNDGALAGALFGLGRDTGPMHTALYGKLARALPAGAWHLANAAEDPTLAAVMLRLGTYRFDRYRKISSAEISFSAPEGADRVNAERIAEGVYLARDLVNTPTNDMGPDELAKAARKLAKKHDADFDVVIGDDLLKKNFPMIHAVGRASASAPRLIDMRWGSPSDPVVTLVGKGVCFDTGGLDIKPASGMLLMKKDMGGAAHVLALGSMIMAAKLPVRLRILVPAVENAISANAFRPGDVLTSRKGLTVEIGNTDAEGRLILADALTLADEEAPQLLIDMATLTGAARTALGPDLPPFYTDDNAFAGALMDAGTRLADPLWRMPLWSPYGEKLSSRIADMNNITSDAFAGSVTAALFLQRFVEKAQTWSHFDIFAWTPVEKPACPIGAEAHAIRALYDVICSRYPR